MRDKLIALINKKQNFGTIIIESQMDDRANKYKEIKNEDIIDYFLENNVKYFPCNVGDTIYDIYEFVHETPFPNPEMAKWTVQCMGYRFDKKGNLVYDIDGRQIPPEEFGKTIFLSEIEALVAIKEAEKGR